MAVNQFLLRSLHNSTMYQRRDLSFSEKLQVLKSYDSLPSMSQREAALKLQISQSQLSRLLKQRNELDNSCVANDRSRKRKRNGKDEDVEAALRLWFTCVRKEDARIDRHLLKKKAHELATKIGKKSFVATDGWLSRWLVRENINYQKPHGERGEADTSAAETWIREEWPKLISTFAPKDIYNEDETCLYFRALPEHTYAFKNDKAKGVKTCKERITLLLCASMAGEKKPLIAIGKPRNPRCFKNVLNLPCKYKFNKTAWMTSQIYAEHLLEWDRSLDHDILLLIDNCSAHTKLPELKHIKVVFLPKNTTSLMQPCDQGIIRTLKAYYRNEMRSRILRFIDSELTENTESDGLNDLQISRANCLAKRTSLLDALHLCVTAWSHVSETTIKNCFKKGGFCTIETDDMVQIEPAMISPGLSVREFDEWMSIDENVQTSAPTTEDDIVAQFIDKEEAHEDEENENCIDSESKFISDKDMCNALEVLRQGVFQRACDFYPHYAYEKYINTLLDKKKRQTTLDEFTYSR